MSQTCKKCNHVHQGLRCGYVLKWTSNNIPEEICLCEKSRPVRILIEGKPATREEVDKLFEKEDGN